MIIPAIVTIAAITSFVILTDSEAVWILQEQVYDLIVIRHLIKFLFSNGSEPSFPLGPSSSLKLLLVELFLLVQERIMLDYIVDIVHLGVVLWLHYLLMLGRWHVYCPQCLRHHHL